MSHATDSSIEQPPPPKVSIVWFRRDLRLNDNPALTAAVAESDVVIPIYIWAPEEEGRFVPGRCNRRWLQISLPRFDTSLRKLGSRLIYLCDTESYAPLLKFCTEVGATAVYFNDLYDPLSLIRDKQIVDLLATAGINSKSFKADILYQPSEILNDDGSPYSAYAPFWTKLRNMPCKPALPHPTPQVLPAVPESVQSLCIDDFDLLTSTETQMTDSIPRTWNPGEEGAYEVFSMFLQSRAFKVFASEQKILNSPQATTSQISAHLHFGEISILYIWHQVIQHEADLSSTSEDRKDIEAFLVQLGYREYSRYISYHFPFTYERPVLDSLLSCPWRYDEDLFKRWFQGKTGYPVIDAAMQQLWSMGWLHNRLRVLVASFLVKNLLLPWQWGMHYLWQTLVDADMECNMLGWQYVSDGLSDGHNFEHFYNIAEQSKIVDPTGEYIARWIPILDRMPRQYIHEPWEAPKELLEAVGVDIGSNYPKRIILPEESEVLVGYAVDTMKKVAAGEEPDPMPRFGDADSGGGDSDESGLEDDSGDASSQDRDSDIESGCIRQSRIGSSISRPSHSAVESCAFKSSNPTRAGSAGTFNTFNTKEQHGAEDDDANTQESSDHTGTSSGQKRKTYLHRDREDETNATLQRT